MGRMLLLLFHRVSLWDCLQRKKAVNKKVIRPRCIPPREVPDVLSLILSPNMGDV